MQGPQGDPGTPGAPGAPGSNGINGARYIVDATGGGTQLTVQAAINAAVSDGYGSGNQVVIQVRIARHPAASRNRPSI
ncbi:MAG: hypothetical protein ACREJD_11900 [Phycisphaerales bacterium]